MADQLKMHKQKIRMIKMLKKDKMDRDDFEDFIGGAQIKGGKSLRRKTFLK